MITIHPAPLLKFALTADALVSGAVAALQLLLIGQLSELLALPRMLLLESGIFLVGYTMLLAFLARRARVPRPLILLLIAGNVGWAIACAGLLAGLASPSGLALAFVAVQAVTVLLFAGLQWAGLKASRPAHLQGEPA